MTRNLIRSLATVAGLSVALGACDGTGPDRPAGVTLLLTDAPANLAEAQIKVDRVYMQGTGGQTDLVTTQSDWINLIELAGEVTETLVEGVPVPPGSYNQMRMIVTEAYIRTHDDEVYAMPGTTLPPGVTATGVLHGPSFAQTGIKVNMPDGGLTVDEGATILVIDFDVERSFGQRAGASGRWVLHPTLRATDITLSGNIVGDIVLAEGVEFPDVDDPELCGGHAVAFTTFVPTADAGEMFATGLVEEDGSFTMSYVHPATYDMGYENEVILNAADEGSWVVTFQASADPSSATVPQAGSVTVQYTIEDMTCAFVEAEGD
jgi:hypothetical protein